MPGVLMSTQCQGLYFFLDTNPEAFVHSMYARKEVVQLHNDKPREVADA